jgi:Aspartyl protease
MAQGTLRSVTAVAAVLVCGQSLQSAETIAEVPFELYQRHLVVTKGSIGPLKGLDLLIDTGTIPSVLDGRLARKLRLRTESSRVVAFGKEMPIRSAVVDGFRIGTLQSGPVPVAVGDLSYVEGVRIDAIVGLDVLARRNFSIDYRTHMLSFAPGGQEKSVAPLELAWPFLTVRMAVAGQQMRLLVDTGSPDLVLFKTRMPAALSNPPWKGDKTVQYAAGAARLLKLELRQAALGPDSWDKLTAWSLDRGTGEYPPGIDGVLGVAALACRRVRFDFEKGEFGWTR